MRRLDMVGLGERVVDFDAKPAALTPTTSEGAAANPFVVREPIVRCRDCMFWATERRFTGMCVGRGFDPDGFCSWGEAKDKSAGSREGRMNNCRAEGRRADGAADGAEWFAYRRDQARAYMERVRDAIAEIEALNAEADRLRNLAHGLVSGQGCGPSRTQPYADRIPDAVARLEEVTAERAERAARLGSTVAECGMALDSLGGRHASLLRLHYVGGVPLSKIGEMDAWKHSRQYMSALHNAALAELYSHMPHAEREPLHPAL